MFELPHLPASAEAPIVVVDVETTGFEARTHEILSIALILCDAQLNPSITTSHFVALELSLRYWTSFFVGGVNLKAFRLHRVLASRSEDPKFLKCRRRAHPARDEIPGRG